MQAMRTLAEGRYRRPLLTVEVPGREPIRGASALIANTHPWSYVGKRPLHVADRATFEEGLDIVIPVDFRRRHAMRLFRYAFLTGKHADDHDRNVRYLHDVEEAVIRCDAPLPVRDRRGRPRRPQRGAPHRRTRGRAPAGVAAPRPFMRIP